MFRIFNSMTKDFEKTPSGRDKRTKEGSKVFNKYLLTHIPNYNINVLVPKIKTIKIIPKTYTYTLPIITNDEYNDILHYLGINKDNDSKLKIDVKPKTLTIEIDPKKYWSENEFRKILPIKNNKRFFFIVFNKDRYQNIYPEFSNREFNTKNVNDFYHKVVLGLYNYTKLIIVIYPKKLSPQNFTLYTNPKINCVLDAILRQIPRNTALKAKILKIHDTLGSEPATKEFINKISTHLRIRFIIMSQVGVWLDTDPEDKLKRRVCKLFAHNDHASEYKPVSKYINNVLYVTNSELDTLRSEHAPMKLSLKIEPADKGDININYLGVQISDTIYKIFKPSNEDINDKLYFRCMDEVSYQYKKFTINNRLRKLNQPYQDILKSADHHLTTQQFMPIIKDKMYHNCDMNKAFPSFKNNKYYPRFAIRTGFMTLIKNSELDLIKYPGQSYVVDVEFSNELLNKIRPVQIGWYNHIELYFLLEGGYASFSISHTLTSLSEDLQFPFKPFDSNPDNKKFNNNFIGKLIAGNNDFITDYYQASSESELNQLRYELSLDLSINDSHINPLTNMLEVERKCKSNALYHIHSDILSYQRTTFLQCMIDAEDIDCKVVAYCVDGFFTTSMNPINYSLRPHEFKYEYMKINFDSTYSPNLHECYFDPKDYSVPRHIYENRMGEISLTNGPPGCGKSYQIIFNNILPDTTVLTPTNVLKYNHKIKQPANTYATLHKFFGIGVKYEHKQKVSENIIIDEITQVPKELLDIIREKCWYYRMNLRLIGDIDVDGIHQRHPPQGVGTPLTWDYFSSIPVVTEISTKRRQNAFDSEYLDSLRNLSDKQVMNTIMNNYRIKKISKSELLGIASLDQGVSMTHARCTLLGNIINMGKDLIQCRYVGKSRKLVKGGTYLRDRSIVWCEKTKWDQKSKFDYESNIFMTSDAIQGDTIDGKIAVDIIDCSYGGKNNFLYTAITRCVSIDDIILITD